MEKTNCLTLMIAGLLLTTKGQPQSTIYIAPASNVYITAGTIFSADSLGLKPSVDFNIVGENSQTTTSNVTHLSANPYIKRVFHFLNTTAPFNGEITIYYRDAELNGLIESALTLNVHNGTAWNAFTTNVSRDAANNFVTTTGLTSLSLNELTLAGLSTPLPVTFTLLNTTCSNGGVIVHWQTAQEDGSKNFVVQSSLDGVLWKVVGSLPAAGNSATPRNYNFTHNNAPDKALYRIAEFDVNGHMFISGIIRSACVVNEIFAVHPNPAQSVATITITLTTAATVSFLLYDSKGSLLAREQHQLLAGNNTVELYVSHFANGVYQLTAKWENTVKQIRIIKK